MKVSLLGYFAPSEQTEETEEPASTAAIKTKEVTQKHQRISADKIEGQGEVFVDHWEKPIPITLGDDRLPLGLWKAIEHMRIGETSRVMIKPKWGYNHDKYRDTVFFPRGWDTEEKKAILRKRRVFFDVTLHEWTVRHDIQGDGLLIKTLLEKGKGFDRASLDDTVVINLKIYQRDEVFYQQDNLKQKITRDSTVLFPTIVKILESMKRGEKVQCLVQPAYYMHSDKLIRSEKGFPNIDEDKILQVDIDLLELHTLTDLYRDGTTFYQTLEAGNTGNTASPFNDCKVLLYLKVQVDADVIFDNFGGNDPLWYDLEEFQLPAVISRVLKVCKL